MTVFLAMFLLLGCRIGPPVGSIFSFLLHCIALLQVQNSFVASLFSDLGSAIIDEFDSWTSMDPVMLQQGFM